MMKFSVSLEVCFSSCSLDNFPHGITSFLGSALQRAVWPHSHCIAASAGGGCGHCPWQPSWELTLLGCAESWVSTAAPDTRPLQSTGTQNYKLRAEPCWTQLLGCAGHTGAGTGRAKALLSPPVSAWVKAALVCASVYHQDPPF